MGVSKNRGTPKSSILIGFSIINHPFWGNPIFGNTQIKGWKWNENTPNLFLIWRLFRTLSQVFCGNPTPETEMGQSPRLINVAEFKFVNASNLYIIPLKKRTEPRDANRICGDHLQIIHLNCQTITNIFPPHTKKDSIDKHQSKITQH